ncbi:MAG: hypothetical protein WC301_07195 [Candidatus Omnitrophota bacterium]|jgi:hypothetical protein
MKGKGILFLAFPNTGKTYLSFGMVRAGFARLLSDEYVLAGEGKDAKAFFGMSALSPYSVRELDIRLTLKEKVWMFFCKARSFLLPFLFEPVIWINTTRIFPGEQRKDSTAINYLFFLERAVNSNGGLKQIDKKEAVKRLIILTENEFPFLSNSLLQTYSCASDDFDLSSLHAKFREIARGIAEGADKAFIYSFRIKEIKGIYEEIAAELKA